MTRKTKKEIAEEQRKRSRSAYIIRKEIEETGREPVPGEIEKLIEKRKSAKMSQNPVMEYYRFYQNKISPDVPIIKDRIEKSKTNEMRMYIEDFANKTDMIGKHPHTIVEKSRPALLIEGISINLVDKGKFIIMKKTTEKEKLTGKSRSIADRVCKIDPQTNNPRVLEFQNKICQLE